jgi:hypothetical protein
MKLKMAALFWGAISLGIVASGAADTSHSFDGSWKGVIQVQPAELEIEFQLDLQPDAKGQPVGRISFPSQNIHSQPLKSLAIDGRSIAFVFVDPHDVSNFKGELLSDGFTIDGTLTEGENVYPFSLERNSAGPTVAPALHDLSADGSELKSLFNRDRDKVRLLLVLSPSCSICRDSARIVQKYVLDALQDPRLQVYVVWEQVQKEDSRQAAAESTSFLADPRATHFWSDSRFAGKSFQRAVGLTKFPAWDVFLVFGPGKQWLADAPEPSYFMHNLLGNSELPKDRHLNGQKLAEEVRQQLAIQPAK